MTEILLRAVLTWSPEALKSDEFEHDIVDVYVGDTLIVSLPMTADPSRAGHGDDSTYFASEERRMIEETLAPYLQRIFTNPAKTT